MNTGAILGQIGQVSKTDHLYGYNMADGLRKYRADLGVIDTSIAHVLYLGDSIVWGTTASDPINKSIPGRLRQIIQSKYGVCGEGFVAIDDNRWSSAGSWSAASNQGFGGHMKFASGNTNTLTITLNCTSFDVLYHTWSGGGPVGVTVDGVAQTAINCQNATDKFGNRQTFSGFTVGNHTIVLTAPSTGRGDLEGIIPYTDSKGVMIHRVGIPGITSSGWTQTYSSVGWNNLGLSLAIVEVGINDCKTSLGVQTLLTNLTTIVNNINVQSPSPSILFHINNRQQEEPLGSNWSQYMPVYYQLADTFNGACFDISKMWGGTYTYPNSIGLYGDDIHPNDKGCYNIAQVLSKHLIYG